MILEFAEKKDALKPWLRVVYPPELATEHAVGPGPLVVGRSASHATFVLDDEWVSRRHCRLWRDGDKVMVEDLGSTNGTFIGGNRVREAELRLSDELQLGRIVLKLDMRTDAPEATSAPAAPPVPEPECAKAVADFLAQAAKCGVSVGVAEIAVSFDAPPKDEVLAFAMEEISETLRREQLSDDLLARSGENRFLFLMNDISARQIATFCANLRGVFERQRFLFEGEEVRVRVSLRTARFEQAPEGLADVEKGLA